MEVVDFLKEEVIFSQGDPAECVGYIQKGNVKLSVVSPTGKEAVVAVMGPGDFVGEGCLAAQPVRTGTATAITPSRILSIDKKQMQRLLHEQSTFANRFITYLLERKIRIELDLVDL